MPRTSSTSAECQWTPPRTTTLSSARTDSSSSSRSAFVGTSASTTSAQRRPRGTTLSLRRYWGRVDLVCILIGHTGTTLNDTASDITTALAKVRPFSDVKGKSRIPKTQKPSKTSVIHDKQAAKNLLDKLCALAQMRLLGRIAHRGKQIKEQIATNTIRITQSAAHEAPRHHPSSTPRQPITYII
jgi:hypothetical protein